MADRWREDARSPGPRSSSSALMRERPCRLVNQRPSRTSPSVLIPWAGMTPLAGCNSPGLPNWLLPKSQSSLSARKPAPGTGLSGGSFQRGSSGKNFCAMTEAVIPRENKSGNRSEFCGSACSGSSPHIAESPDEPIPFTAPAIVDTHKQVVMHREAKSDSPCIFQMPGIQKGAARRDFAGLHKHGCMKS